MNENFCLLQKTTDKWNRTDSATTGSIGFESCYYSSYNQICTSKCILLVGQSCFASKLIYDAPIVNYEMVAAHKCGI